MHIIFNIPVEAVEISPADGNVYVAPFCMGASGPGSEQDNPMNVVFAANPEISRSTLAGRWMGMMGSFL